MIKVGDVVPFFALPNQHSVIVSLDQLKDHWVVLYFYPKNNTPGCTQEACDFSRVHGELKRLGCKVFGVSKDSSKSHTNFIAKYSLPFDFLSDADGEICKNFGVWVEKSMYGKKYFGIERSTFLIDPNGVIAHIWKKVSVNNVWKETGIQNHAQDVLKILREKHQ